MKRIHKTLAYIEQNKPVFENELAEFLKIPSISAQQKHKEDTKKAAAFIADEFKKAGLNNIEIINYKNANPLVYAELIVNPQKPTVLFYGHYDVQPVDPLDKWDSDPFQPVIKNNYIYARGASDDKGQLFAHIKSIEAFFKTGEELPVNAKFIIEGDEEASHSEIEDYIKNNSKKLEADTVLISDTNMHEHGLPTITYALRGIAGFEIHVSVAGQDLHSGQYGGSVANPNIVLSHIISKLIDDRSGKVLIPGFYKDVLPLSKKEKDGIAKLSFSEKAYLKETGAPKIHGEKGFSTFERAWARPTLDVNGMSGGYTEEGMKTILPSKAFAKITMRLVANQNPLKIEKLFKDYVKKISPDYARVKVIPMNSNATPAYTSIDNKYNKAACQALKQAFNKEPVFTRSGGSIPVVTAFQKYLKAPVILMALGHSDDNIHSPNEHFSLDNFHKGIKTTVHFLNFCSTLVT